MTLARQDLQYQYKWTTGKKSGMPPFGATDVELDRDNAFEVLGFINGYIERTRRSASDGQLAELLIKTELPVSLRSHTQIIDWLDRHLRQPIARPMT